MLRRAWFKLVGYDKAQLKTNLVRDLNCIRLSSRPNILYYPWYQLRHVRPLYGRWEGREVIFVELINGLRLRGVLLDMLAKLLTELGENLLFCGDFIVIAYEKPQK